MSGEAKYGDTLVFHFEAKVREASFKADGSVWIEKPPWLTELKGGKYMLVDPAGAAEHRPAPPAPLRAGERVRYRNGGRVGTILALAGDVAWTRLDGASWPFTCEIRWLERAT